MAFFFSSILPPHSSAVSLVSTFLLLPLCSLGSTGCTPDRPDAYPIHEASTTSAALDGTDDPRVVSADALTTPAVGARSPDVVVTVFSDFQCQFCVRVPMFVNKLAMGYGGRVQVQHRHFPLEGAHPHALRAAVAAQAAHRQRAFPCFSRTLYRTRDDWNRLDPTGFETQLSVIAERCGLDSARFTADLADPALVDKVRADQTTGRELGVRGTPTFLVNGHKPATLRMRPDRPIHSTLDSLVLSELRAADKYRAEHGSNDGFLSPRIYTNTQNPDAPALVLE